MFGILYSFEFGHYDVCLDGSYMEWFQSLMLIDVVCVFAVSVDRIEKNGDGCWVAFDNDDGGEFFCTSFDFAWIIDFDVFFYKW